MFIIIDNFSCSTGFPAVVERSAVLWKKSCRILHYQFICCQAVSGQMIHKSLAIDSLITGILQWSIINQFNGRLIFHFQCLSKWLVQKYIYMFFLLLLWCFWVDFVILRSLLLYTSDLLIILGLAVYSCLVVSKRKEMRSVCTEVGQVLSWSNMNYLESLSAKLWHVLLYAEELCCVQFGCWWYCIERWGWKLEQHTFIWKVLSWSNLNNLESLSLESWIANRG